MSLFSSDSSLDTMSLGGNSSTAYSTSPSFVAADDDSFLGSSKASTKRHRRQGSQALLDLSAGDRRIALLRRLIYLAILLLGLGIAFLVYFAIDEEEKQAFESHFQEDATQVLQSFTLQIDLVFGALNTFALNIASIAKATNQTWPNVTVPDFGAKAETTRALSNALYISLYMNVQAEERDQWEAYTADNGRAWVEESLEFQKRQGLVQDQLANIGVSTVDDIMFFDVIHDYDEYNKPEEQWGIGGTNRTGPYLPFWQNSPMIPVEPPYNWDLYSWPGTGENERFFEDHQPIFSETYLIAEDHETEVLEEIKATEPFHEAFIQTGEDALAPICDLLYPVIPEMADWSQMPFTNGGYSPSEHRVGAMVVAASYWRDWIKGILPEGRDGVIITWTSPCAPSFTYQIDGPDVLYLGVGERHEHKFSDMKVQATYQDLISNAFNTQVYTGIPLNPDPICPFTLNLYPSTLMEEKLLSERPLLFSMLTIGLFIVAALTLYAYDHRVEQRKRKLVKTAENTDAIVSNLLPANVRDILYNNVADDESISNDDDNKGVHSMFKGGVIAELYPSATIVFADISRFTAWSSTREPTQVFHLLETVYTSWDKIAYRYDVTKIETVGDCYVAVCGIPTTQNDHVLAAARFARDIIAGWSDLATKLEVALGPDTGDLKVRIGIHSGQVTAGVLRGTMARYQLFGDTVNTCSRIQASSDPGRIHVSSASAEQLLARGKASWLRKRKGAVKLKGKGKVETYWLALKATSRVNSKQRGSSNDSLDKMILIEEHDGDTEEDTKPDSELEEWNNFGDPNDDSDAAEGKLKRLVDWNANVLGDLINQILSARDWSTASDHDVITAREKAIGHGRTILEEFKDIIEVSPADMTNVEAKEVMNATSFDDVAMNQLREFLSQVASMYRSNHFHNFEHASHVTSSVRKLLSRIVNVDNEIEDLSGHSYGITSDPLTQFVVVLSAVIHDCDHPGVPNATLVTENTDAAVLYKGKSIAEQNSVDLCWGLLMEPSYAKLRSCIYHNEAELLRFRQLLVNIVMATDIADKELGALRKARWNIAFTEDSSGETTPMLNKNRKATIVLEHLIQASDVCHTMQHWHIFRKWNERLFFEMYSTYKEGRSSVDPREKWYESEIGFFDFYVIPLAKKLETCGVFGVSSHEYLEYAISNKEQWVLEGKACLEEYQEKFELETGDGGDFK